MTVICGTSHKYKYIYEHAHNCTDLNACVGIAWSAVLCEQIRSDSDDDDNKENEDKTRQTNQTGDVRHRMLQ